MKIVVCSLCYNERDVLPFYLRHYGSFADEIHVWDDNSTDGSRKLLAAHPLVRLHDWRGDDNGISEDTFLRFAHEKYPTFAGKFDWVIWPDIDEFVYHAKIKSVLESALRDQHKILATTGFTMLREGLPPEDGKSQIYDLAYDGIFSLVYSKPIVFQPDVHVRWVRGKHGVENTPTKPFDAGLKLLHYRYLGYEYTRQKHAKNYGRCDMKRGDKAAAWSCAPDFHGDYSPEWVAKVMELGERVI
jgi:hypothetical protein